MADAAPAPDVAPAEAAESAMANAAPAPDVAPAAGEEDLSAVKASIAAKGTNSYYYAHGKDREDLSAASRIEGDGLGVEGGPAAKAAPDKWLQEEAEKPRLEASVRWREDYAWGDENTKVKIYVDFPEGSLGHADCRVKTSFEELRFRVTVEGAGGSAETVGISNGEHPLSYDVVPDKCTHRINSSKSRLTITLFKKDPQESWSSLKKKVMSQHTGWN